MPIYEYRCLDCRRKISVFVRSITSKNEPLCSNCGSANLERLFSRVIVRRGAPRSGMGGSSDTDADYGGETDWTGDTLGGFGDSPYGADPYGDMGDPFGFGEDADPTEIARWTRQMSAQMGEPLDADLDQALADIERGADPDEALERLDSEGLPEPE